MKLNKLPENTDKKGIDSKLFIEINDIIGFLKKLMEEKESLDKFEKITIQWQTNNKLYVVPAWTEIKLLKDWKQTVFETNEDTIIGESTFLAYLDNQSIPANATVEIKWKYYEIPFDKLKEALSEEQNTEFKENLIRFLKELEEKRKGKTEPVVR